MDTDRRTLLTMSFALCAAGCATPATRLATGANDRVYTFFSPGEARFVEAFCDTVIPPGGIGPGAREAGVPVFIDRALQSAYGAADGTYQQGPFREGSPEQGYQLPAEPSAFYRVAVRDVDGACRARFGGAFPDLAPNTRADALEALSGGRLELSTLPGPLVFGTMWFDVLSGYFSDPMHGGNRNKAAWEMIGFPGANADLRGFVGARRPSRRALCRSRISRKQGDLNYVII